MAVVRALLALALGAVAVSAQSTTCVICSLVLSLVEQKFENATLNTSANPDETCKSLGLCDGSCNLWNGTWPQASPNFPTDGKKTDHRMLSAVAPGAALAADALAATITKEAAIAALTRVAELEKEAGGSLTFTEMITSVMKMLAKDALSAVGPCSDGLDIACDIKRVFDDHLPLVDHDNDTFAGDPQAGEYLDKHFRGSNWRGRDCDDSSGSIYPGRSAALNGYDVAIDSNCNGIYGQDPATGKPYEEEFCSGPNAPMGLAILGDSAAAHFHIPPQYVNAQSWDFNGLLELAGNEADWPQCSWSTGYQNVTSCPNIGYMPSNYTVASIYQRMLSRNRCMHRDLQNLGVNGARVGSMAPPGIINSFQRSQNNDAPMLVIHALIGNDVCNGHPGSDHMTTVQDFHDSVLLSLQYLENALPAGSHVAFLGLADGRVLYDTTHTHTHPIGATYPEVYECLSCNGANPCWGWLNTNETWRNFTSERAANLTAVYDTIIAQNSSSFKNFDMYRLNVDWRALINQYVAAGGNAFDVIEPVDGFHPSQTGNYLLAEVVWQDLLTNKPNWLPPVNPNNDRIVQVFGDQGGY